MVSDKTIFFAALDWGLGHATRSVPIIKELSLNNRIIIGVTSNNRFYFEKQFPAITKIELPAYGISYSKIWPVWFKLLLQSPFIFTIIKKENKQLEKIINENKIDLVISDNRFGLFNKKVRSVFITHQFRLAGPFSFIASFVNRKLICKFDEAWVPDYDNKALRLSGKLSDPQHIGIPVTFIGPKSALSDLKPEISEKKIDCLILLSGTEPQRSVLEKILVKKFMNSPLKIVLVRGSNTPMHGRGNFDVINFTTGEELRDLIVNARTVICRSGYSTLMDLHALNKKNLILVPTPGQTEQEYLAIYWKEKFGAIIFSQNEINQMMLDPEALVAPA